MGVKDRVVALRRLGMTYGEMQEHLGERIAKSTLSYWCRGVPLPEGYHERIQKKILEGLSASRAAAWVVRKEQQRKIISNIKVEFEHLAHTFESKDTAWVALAMLCLGEAAKGENLYLGSADERIIRLFIGLLRRCVDFDMGKVRCTVQCRADQNKVELEKYWQQASGVPRLQFFRTRVDKRTVGKKTLNEDYRGVLRVDYFDARVQKKLKVLYNLLAEQI